jgi:hypothetical protein
MGRQAEITYNIKNRSVHFLRHGRTRSLLALVCVTLLPVALTIDLWREIWRGVRPLAWDGSGHFALASIYSETIFPDTFGWTHAYFAGMPFPNFYPPLFYWCVALLHHTNLFSFATSFKTVLVLSVLLLPVAIWTLTWSLTDGNRTAATAAALASIPLLVDYRFRMVLFPSGLDYVSTFQAGLFTHPLGFVLLAAWLVVYTRTPHRRWRIIIASLLLALTVLANFFNAVTAAVFVLATLLIDVTKCWSRANPGAQDEARRRVLARTISPLIAGGLVLFWAVPMFTEYSYFVTRPQNISVFEFIPPAMWYWYALSGVGFLFWLRRPTHAMMPFLAGCVILECIIIFSSELAPRWFPLQPLRFLSTLNLLLAVPVGYVLIAFINALVLVFIKTANFIRFHLHRLPLSPHAEGFVKSLVTSSVLIMIVFSAILFIEIPYYARTFSASSNERIDPILAFAKEHTDGRYLIEHAIYVYPGSALDVRALNSYLGTQGNEAVTVVFREASPNSMFFNPLVGALSVFSDIFGMASVLADDIDFAEQPVARHLERALSIGVKYIVVASPRMKELISRERLITARHDFGPWSIFELEGEPLPRAQALPYRPALVISSLSFKQRRRNQYDFVRLAEEQFADGWFDVLLVRSPELKIDRVQELDNFGALILDTYECSDEDSAFEKLRTFARSRPLVLLSSNAPLYQRIRQAINEFAYAEIIERSSGGDDRWLEVEGPTFRYNETHIRKEWQAIRRVLDRQKMPTNAPAAITADIKPQAIALRHTETVTDSIPVLIKVTYHPNWQRTDGMAVYATTPFFMVTFVRQSASVVYARRWFDWIGLFASTIILIFLCFFAVWPYRRHIGSA